MKTNNEIRKVVESMSLDELCGQVLNIDLASPDFEISEYDGIFKDALGFCIYRTGKPALQGHESA